MIAELDVWAHLFTLNVATFTEFDLYMLLGTERVKVLCRCVLCSVMKGCPLLIQHNHRN